jgi:hypothetical protein
MGVQLPSHHDQAIIPMVNKPPAAMKTQGLAWYKGSGIQRFMRRFYSLTRAWFTLLHMPLKNLRKHFDSAPPGRRLLWLLAAGVLAGFVLLPALIYLVGTSLLGSYEGASLPGQYSSVYRGLAQGNWASWIVVLGPALLFLLGRALLAWWRGSAALAR